MTETSLANTADVLSPAEAAQRLHVTTQTLRNWAGTGRLSPIRTAGGHRRYLRAEVDALAAEMSTPTA